MDTFILFALLGVAIVGLILSTKMKSSGAEFRKLGDHLIEQSKEAMKLQNEVVKEVLRAIKATTEPLPTGISVDKLPPEMQEVIISQVPIDDDNFTSYMEKLYSDNSDKR